MSGVLLHVTSLPSYGGVGDFGPAAYEFVDFLAAAKQRLWQVLPLSPDGIWRLAVFGAVGVCGQSACSSAWNGWYRMAGLRAERIEGLPGHDGPADFVDAMRVKLPLVEEAAANFLDRAPDDMRVRFQKFCKDNISWLPDYAMFNVLRRMHGYISWNRLAEEYAQRKNDALTAAAELPWARTGGGAGGSISFSMSSGVRCEPTARERKIRILGDVAIFVNYDSADVWTHPEIFELDEDLKPTRVSGVPPDYFSSTGQRWGNPLYKWGLMKERGFDWWVARIRRCADAVRLDPAGPLSRI